MGSLSPAWAWIARLGLGAIALSSFGCSSRVVPAAPPPAALTQDQRPLPPEATVAWRDAAAGAALVAIRQRETVRDSPDLGGDRGPYLSVRGLTRLVAARYLLDGKPLSLRSSLDVYPELDEHFHRPPPTEWYYTRASKDPTLPDEAESFVWGGPVDPGERILTVELVYTIPQCCYAGCFPKRLAVLKRDYRWRATPGSAVLLDVRGVDLNRDRKLTEPSPPIEQRLAIDVTERVVERP